MVLMFSSISLVYQFWIHTETIGRMGPLEWVMNTPSHHRVHHAINAKYLDANYAGVLIIWDRLFGTFVPEDDKEKTALRHHQPARHLQSVPRRLPRMDRHFPRRDAARRSLREVLGYMFGPPGWSPDGSRKTSASIKAAWAARSSKPPPLPAE